jgi:hypothetical protein
MATAARHEAAEDARQTHRSFGIIVREGPMRRWIVLGILVLAATSATTQPLYAAAGCTTSLADCYQRAANIDSFWYRWAAGLDCELDFVECTRIKLIGA